MKKLSIYVLLLAIAVIAIFLQSCGRKNTPQIIYKDTIKTCYDTIYDVGFGGMDTIFSDSPCDSFTIFINEKDTVYIKTYATKVVTKTITKKDTIFRDIIIMQPQPKKTKIDNSVTAKKGSIIGNENTMTTKKNNWWWIFLAGMLTWFIIQNVLFRIIKTYFPFLKFLP